MDLPDGNGTPRLTCFMCDKEPVPHTIACADHLIAVTARVTTDRREKKKQGICIECHDEALPGRKRCSHHLRIQAIKRRTRKHGRTWECPKKHSPPT